MSAPSVIRFGGGEVIGDAPDRRVEILSDADGLHATWSRFAAGRDGADLHVHRAHTDLFYVLEGELTLRLGSGGEEVVLPAGTLARMPPLVVHGFRNGGDEEVRYLNLHAPGRGFSDYLRALRDGRSLTYDQFDPPADGGRPVSDAVVTSDGPVLADIAEISVERERRQPGEAPSSAQLPDHVASFYVLEGELVLHAGERELRAAVGSWAQVAPGVEHALAAAGSEPVSLLSIRTPAG